MARTFCWVLGTLLSSYQAFFLAVAPRVYFYSTRHHAGYRGALGRATDLQALTGREEVEELSSVNHRS